ncbi:MAG: serine--tRNA ligase [Candidatus Hydrothermales bacterium]
MIDRKTLRENPEKIKEALLKRNFRFDLERLLEKEKEYRRLLTEINKLKTERNKITEEIKKLKSENKNTEELIKKSKEIGFNIENLEKELREIESEIENKLSEIPNIPHSSVPVGKSSEENLIVRDGGKIRKFDFEVKTHFDLGEKLGILDFKRAGKISGSRFVIYKGYGALLERALIQFFLDIATKENGYVEILPPVLVKDESAYGSAHLPKFDEEMYKTLDEKLYLLPTAETALANLHKEEILKEEDLPIYYVAYTPCFRREAGSYGKDVKGIIRQHQFNKVELFKFTKPEESYEELEKMVRDAEKILQKLDLPYRVVLLCTGDMGFAASKTYDIEVFAPGLNRWLEVSSISNCEDFQAKRTNTRFRRKNGKIEYVHTLNGSGLATPRTFIAILENYQQEDGSVVIPEVLRPYMGGVEKIPAK